ncbi:MAG: exonuclease [Candidatus Omnitrophica bacterium]|nr:exonuclease [Candidatus Omnitrophota bacterium]
MVEIFISTDVESDGPIPGVYSMLSFGSAAMLANKEIISTFSANLETLPGASQDSDTMHWWQGQKDAWDACRKDLQNPEQAMLSYVNWLDNLGGRPVFLAYPASFDFNYIYWYLMKFVGRSPFEYMALDIKSYAMAVLKKPFYDVTKSNMPEEWFDQSKKSHIALEDAIEQGQLFCNILRENIK